MCSLMIMRQVKITAGGQLSVPAEVRHRWNTTRVQLEDRGDHLVLRPAPADPILALRGAFADPSKPSSSELRKRAREEEQAAEDRRS